MWVKLGTATNFCLVVNNTQAWNSIGGKAFTSSDGLSTSKWTHISFTFTAIAPGNINIHLGYHAETAVTQQTAGTVFLWNIEMTEFSSTWIGNVEDEIRLPGSSIWTSQGNVGIGTVSPSSKLHVYDNGGSFRTDLDATYHMGILNEYVSTYVTRTKFGRWGTTSNLELYYDIAGTEEARITRNYSTAVLKFNRSTTTDMIIDGNGRVGIGTASPTTLLSVGGAGSTLPASGITFGADASANLYRESSASIRTDGAFLAAGRIRSLDYIQFNSNLYSNAFTNPIDINV